MSELVVLRFWTRELYLKRARGRKNSAARLATEVGEEPEEERKGEAEHEAGDDGEIESGVFAAVDDVAGKSSKAEGEFSADEQKSTDDEEETSEEEEGAAEFAERIHKNIIEEGSSGRRQ